MESPARNGFKNISPITSALVTLCAGLLLAYVTALRDKPITQEKFDAGIAQIRTEMKQNETAMHDYVQKYSPYMLDKKGIEEHQITQDTNIGRMMAQYEEILQRLGRIEQRIEGHLEKKN